MTARRRRLAAAPIAKALAAGDRAAKRGNR